MNGTVVDIGEVQEYDDLGDFSPVDSMSAWEVGTGVNDFGTVADGSAAALKEEFNDLGATNLNAKDSNSAWLLPWGSTMQPMPMLKSGRKKRSIRDILREVTVSEETLQSAVARLGGGAQGLQVLMDHVNFWASESHDDDVAATIRNGIVDLGMTPPPLKHRHSDPDTNVQTCKNHASEPTSDRGAAYTRALRKSHMVRQRGHPSRAQRGGGHHSLASKSQCGHHSWRSGSHHQSWAHDLNPELGSGNSKGYEFLFHKELRASDVSSLGRIVLPKKDAERHLPFLVVREGMMINLEDYQSGTFWTVRYRFWPNNKSRMYLLENIGGFVTYHRLQEGDLLLCYRNGQGGYVIRGQRVPPSVKVPAKGPSSKGTQAKETTETAGMKSTMDSTPMPPTSQFMEGDQCTIGRTDSNSDLSLDSLECTLRELSDGPKAFEDGYGVHVAEQMGHEFISTYEGDDVLKTGDFGSESYKELDVNGSSFDPMVDMLSVSNVKQRYLDRVEFFEPE